MKENRIRPRTLLALSLACVLPTASLASDDTVLVDPATPAFFKENVDHTIKRIVLDLDNIGEYATVSIFSGEELIVDNMNVPSKGRQTISALVRFSELGPVTLKVKSSTSSLIINGLELETVDDLIVPYYEDISVKAGLDKVNSLKYGGPTVADINNDGFYDFVVNNHNEESSKLYWNNGDGTVTKHHKDLSRWHMHDLHGTSFADYDNDGQLDMILAQGGGNGRNPSRNNFYRNNNGEFVLYTGDVGIERGARGRGSKWADFNGDGKLDFVMINERGLYKETPQHHFYENLGDGKFKLRSVEGIENEAPERALITDLNNDGIDDIILYGHRDTMSVWQGNGDFTFTNITSKFPKELRDAKQISAVVDLDINNNGKTDLYFARGKEFEHGRGEAPSVDFDPETKQFSIKPRPYFGKEQWQFTADGPLKLDNYYFLGQNGFRNKDYPIFLGKDKNATAVPSGGEFEFSAEDAQGWPDDISKSGVYFGHVGNGQWKAALVRKGDIFWAYKFNLTGVTSYELDFIPENRNLRDFLLRNDGDKFVDVSEEWRIPRGGNAQGVTTGDFNNNGRQDLLVYRWGNVNHRISDLMLLNNNGHFETLTMHGASDVGGPGYGDMGQAFDFDMNGRTDILSGSEFGEWYLYSNQTKDIGNYVSVRVGYSPKENIDPISARVTVKTSDKAWHKRVGSAGEIFSQSLLNIVHFGVGDATEIESVVVTWRNGESVEFNNKAVNQQLYTEQLDPTLLSIESDYEAIRKGTDAALSLKFLPSNSNQAVVWSSSNNKVLTVDQAGLVSAVGEVGQSAVITATSKVTDLSADRSFELVDWYPNPLKSLEISMPKPSLIVGDSKKLDIVMDPARPDDATLTWSSSDSRVATVTSDGVVNAIKEGTVVITAKSEANEAVESRTTFTIEPNVAGFVRILDSDTFANKPIVIGDKLTVHIDYHAGTNNKVISADEGGLRIWLRHFQRKWLPQRDIVLVEEEAVNTEAGGFSFSVPLEGVIPTEELPEGHFYSLRATFTASDGTMHDHEIYPLNFVSE
ncbi:VCBS repeat-containing protein [Vibrio sp. SCSIO 43140]|uniref:FG-GAP-like repeat-containing protein n=1 Tax=Vibrio sp. SCSIO 43140 TaxID=2819100 RepID=UPI00207658C9|nr:FG-GAP-like repeat-containing protein [Vibrio sp. SCSIO 43140]USD62515.1 VCBS repeat-containing protein [Vibrio sp. SCSIO 43140]